MKRSLLLKVFMIAYSWCSYGCDICGSYMGITPYGNQNCIGIYYRYRAFNGYNSTGNSSELFPEGHLRNGNFSNGTDHHDGSMNELSGSDYEIYRTAELRAKYYIHERIEFNAIVPYRFNNQSLNDELIKVSGFGDVSLYGGYAILNKSETDQVVNKLTVGGGIKLPTGSFKSTFNTVRVDPLIQPGTGTTDGFVYMNYLVCISKVGIALNCNYKINGTNSLYEHIENSTVGSTSIFYKIAMWDKTFTMVPKVNGYYEYTQGLITEGNYVSGTSMNVLMVGPALDLFYKNLELNITAELPVYDKADNNALLNSGRVSIGLAYNFTQTKYLFKKSDSKN